MNDGLNIITSTNPSNMKDANAFTLVCSRITDTEVSYTLQILRGDPNASSPTVCATTLINGSWMASVDPMTAADVPAAKATAISNLNSQLAAYFTTLGGTVNAPTSPTESVQTVLETAIGSIAFVPNANPLSATNPLQVQ